MNLSRREPRKRAKKTRGSPGRVRASSREEAVEDLFHPRLRMSYFSALDREKLEAERLEQISKERSP